MGHKLPIRAEETTDSDGNLQFLILSSDGCVIAETNRPAGFTDDEITAIKNLIITAVNVMPEVITFLKKLQTGNFEIGVAEVVAHMLLEKLEAVDG